MSVKRAVIRASIAALLLAAGVLVATRASAYTDRTIGVYFDAAGTQCQGTIPAGTVGTVYVLARLDPGAAGFAGFEFRFIGVPSSWTVYPVPNPDVLGMGDPFAAGVVGAFRSCQLPDTGILRLYTVMVLAGADEADVTFDIERREPPSNPGFLCPVLVNCDTPIYTATCVEGTWCTVNASRVRPCAYPSDVAPASWSAVKQFYR